MDNTSTFIAADLINVQVVVGLPWLAQWNMVIHAGEKKLWYAEMRDMVAYTTQAGTIAPDRQRTGIGTGL